MRPFFKLLILTVVVLASVSAWVKYRQELTGTIQTLQVAAADTPTGDPNAPAPTPTHTPTPEPTGVDTTAPQILAIDLQQPSVDTTASRQPVTVSVRISDDLSGFQYAKLRFVPAAGGTQYLEFGLVADQRISGDRRDGVYVSSMMLPKYSAHGRWYLSEVTLADNANNIQYGYGFPDGRNTDPEPVVGEETLYFVNGEDGGPIVVPEATLPAPVEPGPLPPEGGVADDGAEANELRLPLIGD